MAPIKPQQVVHQRQSKRLPLILKWGEKFIYLGEAAFLSDGSFVFESSLHSNKDPGAEVQFGMSYLKDGEFTNQPPYTTHPIANGFHITLHPTSQGKPGVMHFREHSPGKILFRRYIDWHPVIKPFNLLRLFTLPLDTLPISEKQVTITKEFDSSYKDSLEVVLDIFPKDTNLHYPIKNSFYIWGHSPEYLVRISLIQTNLRTPALIYWPLDDKLEL